MFLLLLFKKKKFAPIQDSFHKGIRRRNYMLSMHQVPDAITDFNIAQRNLFLEKKGDIKF
jgi:hypothetical protein